MAGVTVDGNDAVAVWRAARDAIDRARSGEGPTLLEAMTFRFFGHVYGDQSEYIPKAEMAAAMERDPFPRFRASLVAGGHATDVALAGIDAEIAREIDDAFEFAMQSPWPSRRLRATSTRGVAAWHEARAAPPRPKQSTCAAPQGEHDALAEDRRDRSAKTSRTSGGGVMKVTEGLSTRFESVRATPIAEQRHRRRERRSTRRFGLWRDHEENGMTVRWTRS